MLVQSRGRYTLTFFTPAFSHSRLPLPFAGAPSALWMQGTQVWPSVTLNSSSFVAVRSPIVIQIYFSAAVDPEALSANFSAIVIGGNVKWANESSLVAHTSSHYSFEIVPFEAWELRPGSGVSSGDVISIDVPEGIAVAAESTVEGVEEGLPNTAARFSLIYSPRARRRGTPRWHPLAFPRHIGSSVDTAGAGGWVTAVHANLVASTGAVLLTGWKRERVSTCDAGLSGAPLKVGVSFLLDPAHLDALEAQAVALGSSLNLTLPIVALDEAPINATDALYCSGHAPLRDGRKLFAGGSSVRVDSSSPAGVESGLDYARIWDPLSVNFSALTNDPLLPFGQAWHPSLARLPDGRVLMTGGMRDGACASQSAVGAAACFNPALALFNITALDGGASGWQWLLPASASDATALNPGPDDYTRVWVLGSPVLAGGRWRSVAMMGAAGTVVLVDLEASTPDNARFFHPPNGSRPTHTSPAAPTASGSAAAAPCNIGSASVVVSTGELLLVGGCGSSWVDLYNPVSDSWRSLDTGIPRNFASLVLFPDGSVMLLHGENPALDQSAARSGKTQEGDPRYFQVLHPVTLRIDTYPEQEQSLSAGSDGTASIAPFRGLHNTAALLRDGRVLITGGVHHRQRGDTGCEQPTLRLLSPPYFRPFNLSAVANDTTDSDSDPANASTASLPPRLSFDVGVMLNSSWGSPFNASQFAAQFLNGSCAPIFLRVNTTAQIAVRVDSTGSAATSVADLSLRNEPPLDPRLQADGGLWWDSGLRFGGGGLVLLALPSSTHGFDASQRYVSLQYADAESNDTDSWSAGNGEGEQRSNSSAVLPSVRSMVVRVVLPPSPVLSPGEYLLFAVSASGVPSVGMHTRVLSPTEDAATAYVYASPSGFSAPSNNLPYYPISPGDGRGSEASPWDRQNILLMSFLGGAGVLFFLALALWFWRKQSRDGRRADMQHAMRTPAALRMHAMGRTAHQLGFDPLA